MADTTMFTKYAEQNAMKGILDWLDSGAVTLHLIKSTFTLDIDTAGFNSLSVTEADFDGYTAETITFGSIGLTSDKKAQITGTEASFTMNGSTGNTIYGWWMENLIGPSGFIVEVKKYDNPANLKDMTASGNTLRITPSINLFDTSIAP